MTEPSSASAGAPAVDSDVANLPGNLSASLSPSGAGKRSASEAFEGDSVEDLKDSETTLDDVLVSPLGKKSKLLDAELPDVDDNEEFPQQEEDMDADLALGLENGEKDQDLDESGLNMGPDNPDMDNGDVNNQDVEDLAPPEDEEDENEEENDDSEPPTSQNNEIDIVDVDEDEEEEESAPATYQQYSGLEEDEEEEYDDEQETARAIARAQNQREARQLLMQLDDSARSKLCLTALEKYGEELFYGHEDARDAILVDACAQESVLSLMRDAIRVRDLYLRGSSAAAPVELDDDEDEEDTGGYEEEEDDEEEEKPESNDDIVVISEEEEDSDASGTEQTEEQAASDETRAVADAADT
ncbi:hypothetical protein, variant [Phytophthora nicotianae CJ01A1]|uniref:Uncharacterized protein n=5 Tax=Phytophthora nicotianae TaxID=4792 RepID=W2ZX53_PHYNI|nr:hypothetical protein PPTG_07675 [Phytophthora nicotianae INRA-310]XP_008900196.1 hypothetical protein, variant [Phytophthora nicotianae INRA-310]ETM00486.1 hypothetical protein L917_02794 [Phytophthora nicotianae]ETO82850.1 hypothetical protein F444_03053 [Phytophthora nicotianae P1976]ETP23941.1 hypothetical protein F441_02998 [Phytophthora nicotianae CJ01A1]ETP51942.1 hypothetical protein F442_02979 [Phytophthora nicotianae P10297]KUF83765.1 hypothetical protein AM587_10004693 [Phytophth